MQSTNIPSKIPLPFANSASSTYKNTIPTASQIGITNGKASLTDGFPPLTFQALSSGGVPPFGADFNGILYEITAIQQWQEAGGFFPYDSTFSTAVGGYPKGAILQAAGFGGLWVSTVENNTSNPDTGGAGWTSLAFEGSQAITVTTADVTVSQIQSAYPVIIVSGTLTGARNLIFPAIVGEWIIQNNTTGSYTLTAKTASGTGVTLTQGQSTFVYGDGANIVFADSSKVASFNGRVGSVTLTAGDVTGALGYTPVNPTDFVESYSTNGYQKLPSGIIIQWGRFNAPPSGNPWPYGYMPMNITFPNAMFSITGNADSLPNGGGMNNPSGNNLAIVCFENLGTAGVNYRMDTNQGTIFSGTCPISWIAIGY